ncbi:phosphopantetheine-binding protein [Gallaecimonas sp. GXIMD1310]|uniref:phosphopantetheine-binding protein n=1 Tax=Gallaecimonas sp. GXIMD1310 TaxID=3131926 RepID=UPI00324E875C
MTNLETELKTLIISSLELEDVREDDIDTDAALFGDGLGLDSIDALELGLAIQKRYGVKIDANASDTKSHFASVASLAAFIRAQEAA